MTDDATWRDQASRQEQTRLAEAGFGQRVGLGDTPAIIVIDAQNYMIGPPPGSEVADYPSSCGQAGQKALRRLSRLLSECRELGIPIFYSRFELRRDGSDAGVYARKRRMLTTEGWCLEGSEGARIAAAVAPQPGDNVFVKKKPSAFHGTPLLEMLIHRNVDTVVLTGGSTSNCVRATAVDAASYNYRTIIVEDCVFDRVKQSHRVALSDLDRQYGDVVSADKLMACFRRNGSQA